MQMSSLIENIEENGDMNVLIENFEEYQSFRVQNLAEAFRYINSASIIKYYYEEDACDNVSYDKLLENQIISVAAKSYPLKNYMDFHIDSLGAAEPEDWALSC